MSPHEPSPDAPLPAAPPAPLPRGADLDQLRRRAKELRRAVLGGSPDAARTVATYHPLGASALGNGFGLREAQVTVARLHGFRGWHELVQAVGTRRVEERDLHRFLATEFNNEVWDLLDGGLSPQSPDGDKDAALYGAYAAARHWQEVGTVANRARAEHLLARAAVAVGWAHTGLHHARRCLALVEAAPGQAAPDQVEDWDVAFAHEALARALAATGDLRGGQEHRRIAVRSTAALRDPEDRRILTGELARPPWFGLDAP